MSLINQMLQDLEARRATQVPGLTLPSAVRPLPALREPRRSRQLLLAAAVLALAAVALWRFDDVWPRLRSALATSGAGHEASSAPPGAHFWRSGQPGLAAACLVLSALAWSRAARVRLLLLPLQCLPSRRRQPSRPRLTPSRLRTRRTVLASPCVSPSNCSCNLQ